MGSYGTKPKKEQGEKVEGMKFYPLNNWRKGQKVALIDGTKYHTLDAITEWHLDEQKADLAAYRGRVWTEETEKKDKNTATLKILKPKDPKDDSNWLFVKLSEEATMVAVEPEEEQDAGTVHVQKTEGSSPSNTTQRTRGTAPSRSQEKERKERGEEEHELRTRPRTNSYKVKEEHSHGDTGLRTH